MKTAMIHQVGVYCIGTTEPKMIQKSENKITLLISSRRLKEQYHFFQVSNRFPPFNNQSAELFNFQSY
jgi:hypothetical protein